MRMRNLVKARAYDRDRYYKNRAAGVCCRCTKRPSRPGMVLCQDCSNATKAVSKDRRKRLNPLYRDLGICLQCGCRASMPERRWCAVCAEANTEKAERLAKKRISEGRCRRCGKLNDRVDLGTQCSGCCEAERVRNHNRKNRGGV